MTDQSKDFKAGLRRDVREAFKNDRASFNNLPCYMDAADTVSEANLQNYAIEQKH